MSHDIREMCEEMMKAAQDGAAGTAHGSSMATQMAKGAGMAMVGYQAGRGLLGSLARHPLVLLSTGIAAGYLVHKYRKEIVAGAAKVSDAGRDFMQQQKESLADMLEEAKEAEEGKGE